MISWEYFRGLGEGDDANDGEGRGRSPGKVTLTQRLAAGEGSRDHPSAVKRESGLLGANDVPTSYLTQTPVQLDAVGPAHEDPFAMHLIAERGVESAGTPLPHLDKIQASFGPAHDVSPVQAHVGGAAAEAATVMGARAYATGDHVAFASDPDLHTAAHEAAHTVQQRGGVQLRGGVGEAGDMYERHADAVADKVVAGESAASLLDELAGGRGGASVRQQAIQRAPSTVGVPVRPDDDASRAYDQYLGAHWEQLREAVRRHFVDHLAQWNVARLGWAVDGERRGVAIADAIFPTLHITGQLESLVAPEPLGPAIALGMSTMQRPGEGDGDPSWNPAVGTAVARLIERRLAESMARMGARYVSAYDRNGGSVKAADLPRGDAMDGVAAALLTDGLVRVMGPLPAPTRDRGPKKPKAWRWLGARDAGLWNWIEVTDPRDAGLEDVALLLPADVPPIVDGDGRFFRMPEDWARTQPGAAEHEPTDGAVASGVELASSTFAIDAAIAQADDVPKARKRESASDVDARVERNFAAIHQVVALLGDEYADRVVPAFVALVAARDRAGERGQRADIARVLAGQEALLEEILQEIDLFHRTSFGRGRSAHAGPMVAVYIELALAAGNSHLHDVGRRHLATARAKAADVGRRLAEEAVAANAAGANRVAEGGGAGVDDARERQRDRFDRLDSKAADPGSMEVEASLDAFLLHTQSVEEQLDRMVSALYATNERLASIVGMPWVTEAEALAHAVVVVRDKARHVRGWLLERLADTPEAPARRMLLERAQAALAEQITASELIDISRRVVAMLRRVDDADATIQIINSAVTMVGISVIASGAGMFVAGALAPTSAAAGTGVTTLGRVGAAAAGMVTEAVVGGWLQSELLGDNAGEAIAENMIASLLAVGALRGFHGVTQRFGPFTAENIALWERLGGKGAGAVLRTTHLTVEMALGAGAGYAAQNIVRSPVKPTDDEALQWAMQGASMVVGQWITRRMADAHARLQRARAAVPPGAVPRLEQTLKDIDALRARAAAAADNPIDEPAMRELFAEHQRLAAAEDAIARPEGDAPASAGAGARSEASAAAAPPSAPAMRPPIFSAEEIRTQANRAVGNPVSDAATGRNVLRRLNRGDLTALRELGAETPHALEEGLEWGLGETADGKIIVVRGDRGEVDWSTLPGVVPLAHTHPHSPTGNLPPDADGKARLELSALWRVTDVPLWARELVLPSASDVAVMASRGVAEHLVVTPFVVVTDPASGTRYITEARPGSGGHRLEFRILNARLAGYLPSTAQHVYRATFLPSIGGQSLPPIDVYASTAEPGQRSGNIYLEGPAGMVPQAASVPAATGDVVHAPAREERVKRAAEAPAAERRIVLGTDPKRGYIEHEGEVGFLIEKDYGYFERDATGAGEWISLSGPYAGKTFDLLGIPTRAVAFHGDDLVNFLPAIDSHLLKSVDFIVLDVRNMTPAQRKTLDSHIDTNHASAKARIIMVE